MARIFVSFAIEDKSQRDLFVGQKRNTNNVISFTDYSVKEPWSSSWKANCRARIKSCSGVIGLISANTPTATGQLWELACAYDEEVPVLLIHAYSSGNLRFSGTKPTEISGRLINNWAHETVLNFLNKVG